MKAVLWTDTFQIIFILAGLLAALIEGTRRAGGAENVWSIAQEKDRVDIK